MQRKSWYWIFGLALVLLLICGGFVGLGLLVANKMGSSDGLAFGDAVAIVRVEGTILAGEAPPPTPFILHKVIICDFSKVWKLRVKRESRADLYLPEVSFKTPIMAAWKVAKS